MRFDSSDKVTIRVETSDDLLAIRSVNKTAFGRDAEALLVDRLRDESRIFKSLVAVEAGRIVGNIVFSKLRVQTETGGIEALALAPVSVLPDFQGRQIGTRLVIEGLKLCKQGQSVLVLVVGNPKYYSGFGFSAELAEKIRSPYSGTGAAWMALELREGIFNHVSATVAYPDAFKIVD